MIGFVVRRLLQLIPVLLVASLGVWAMIYAVPGGPVGMLVGENATLAEIALFPAIALSRDFGVDHDEYPALRRWMRRVRTIPGFITMPGIPDYH